MQSDNGLLALTKPPILYKRRAAHLLSLRKHFDKQRRVLCEHLDATPQVPRNGQQ